MMACMREFRRGKSARLFFVALMLLGMPLGATAIADDPPPKLQVSTDFPNASGEVEAIDQQARLIKVHPATHPGHGWDCWWYFSVSGIKPGETISVDLSGDRFAQADRATFSIDGHTWQQTSVVEKHAARILYRQRIDAAQAWFAWGPPLTSEDAAELVKSIAAKCPHAEAFELCRSHDNGPVWGLKLVPLVSDQIDTSIAAESFSNHPHGVFVTARQHAWESGGSWVCRGLMEWLASDDLHARELRNTTMFQIVPVMDVDNVARRGREGGATARS